MRVYAGPGRPSLTYGQVAVVIERDRIRHLIDLIDRATVPAGSAVEALLCELDDALHRTERSLEDSLCMQHAS